MKKKLIGLFLLSGPFFTAVAQQNHFLYIQTDQKQPFYVRNGRDVHSSSLSGHLVIPDLKDSTYTLKLGFPKTDAAEQNFSYNPEGKDQGVVVKDFGEKGWGLFNLQTMEISMAGNNMAANKDTSAPGQSGNMAAPGGFIDRLAQVVDDPSIRIKPTLPAKKLPETAPVATAAPKPASDPVAGETTVKPASSIEVKETGIATTDNKPVADKEALEKRAEAVADSLKSTPAIVAAKENNTAEIREETVGKEGGAVADIPAIDHSYVPALKSNVVKKSMTRLDTGHMGIFIDEYASGQRDTIRVFVPKDGLQEPAETPQVQATTARAEKKVAKSETETDKNVGRPNREIAAVSDVQFLDFTMNSADEKKKEEEQKKNSADSVKKTAPVVDSVREVVDTVQGLKDATLKAALKDSVAAVAVPDTAAKSVDSLSAPVIMDTAELAAMASQEEMLDLRRKMIGEASEMDMVDLARKAFREKKYSVAQIRHLAGLFLKEETRYYFLDAAYPAASDKKAFSALEDLLKDEYYINRFRALIGN